MHEGTPDYPAPSPGFVVRRAAIIPSLEYFGLHNASTVVIGTGALALAGVDAHMPGYGAGFDIDTIVPGYSYEQQIPDSREPMQPTDMLPVCVMSHASNPLQEGFPDSKHYAEIIDRAIQPSGDIACRVLQPADAAASKLRRADTKDILGLLKAHIIAHATGHPIIQNPSWMRVVSNTRHYIGLIIDQHPATLPAWVYHLRETHFSHKSFADIRSQL